jgi:hypothetical protein
MVRANIPSATISCDQAATYQVFLRKIAESLIACAPLFIDAPSASLPLVTLIMARMMSFGFPQ